MKTAQPAVQGKNTPRGRMLTGLIGRFHPLAAALLAIVLTLPALTVGLVGDDHYHRAVMLGSRAFEGVVAAPMDMFNFLDGDPERSRQLVDLGFLPWWTYEGVKAKFWRPTTVLTHWLDYRLWPYSPAIMHAHSLLWYGAAVAVVALLYRRLNASAFVAGLAALLYAVDDGHAMPVGFLANRNILVCGVFGVLALLAHDRWRRNGWRAGAVFAPLLLLLSLLAKEAGIAVCAYLAAHALFLDRRHWGRRCLVLLPYAVIVVGWRAIWSYLGYGVADAGLYVDPLTDPARFGAAVIERTPILLLGQWAWPPSEIVLAIGAKGVTWLWRGAAAFLTLTAVLLIPLWRRDRLARFWAVGMLLAVIPCCATFPADRLLFFVGIGATGLLAQFLDSVFFNAAWRPTSRHWRVPAACLAWIFVVIHLVVGPVALPVRTAYPLGPRSLERCHLHVRLDESVEDQDLVVVNPPTILHVAYLSLKREFSGLPAPRRVRQLAPGGQPVHLYRPDRNTLVIRPADGYVAWIFERLLRNAEHPLAVGDRIELTGLVVEVTALTDDQRPAEATFRFAVPLEDDSLRWLCWKDGLFRPFTPPAVGEQVVLTPGKLYPASSAAPGGAGS